MSAEGAVAGALYRAAVYRLLAAAFAYPTTARLEWLAAAAWKAAVTAPPALRVALRRLADAAAGADDTTLAGEHVALFQRQVACPPYEGAWGPARLAGKATLLADVAGFYRAFGLEPAEGQPEIEDHVGAELEFMSVLAVKEAWALTEGHDEGLAITCDAQRTFLADHLGRWGSALATRVAGTAAPGFYPAVAALLETWLLEECTRLGLTVTPVEGTNEAEAGAFTCPMATAADAGAPGTA